MNRHFINTQNTEIAAHHNRLYTNFNASTTGASFFQYHIDIYEENLNLEMNRLMIKNSVFSNLNILQEINKIGNYLENKIYSFNRDKKYYDYTNIDKRSANNRNRCENNIKRNETINFFNSNFIANKINKSQKTVDNGNQELLPLLDLESKHLNDGKNFSSNIVLNQVEDNKNNNYNYESNVQIIPQSVETELPLQCLNNAEKIQKEQSKICSPNKVQENFLGKKLKRTPVKPLENKVDSTDYESEFPKNKVILKNKKFVYAHKDNVTISETFKKAQKKIFNTFSEEYLKNYKLSTSALSADQPWESSGQYYHSLSRLVKEDIFSSKKFNKSSLKVKEHVREKAVQKLVEGKNKDSDSDFNFAENKASPQKNDKSQLIEDFSNENLINVKKTVFKRKSKPRVLSKSRKSKYRGVSRNGNQWQVLIMIKNSKRYIGSYSTEEKAAQAYDKVAIHYHKTKAKTNFFYNQEEIKQILSETPLIII